MAATFLSEAFLLESSEARSLYFDFAEPLPIIDYHCHLSPKDIADNRTFENLTQIWLAGDHYKWRAMRTAGVDERFVTGAAPDREKFQKWAETVPKTLRNPLYHWTHLELRRPFGITDRTLDPDTAQGIWDECGGALSDPAFSTQGLLRTMKVEVVCTTDDPTDSLEHHRTLSSLPGIGTRVLPTFRPDKALEVSSPSAFRRYVELLGEASGETPTNFERFLSALDRRHAYFHDAGCRLSDHGLETVPAEDYTKSDVELAFDLLMRGEPISRPLSDQFKAAVFHELGLMNHRRGWVQQLHVGALRNNNTRMMKTVGPDTGFDSIGDAAVARPIARFLDGLDVDDCLAKTILYNLNPRDNEVFASMIGNFQDGSVPGKIQYGAAWWFLDQADGMTRQLSALSNLGLLSQFVGMVTDSRSFLSYSRHEYFRRLLCNLLGHEMKLGLLPRDMELVGGMVADICYYNAKRYFGFGAG
jgi:glucuronate isomerase